MPAAYPSFATPAQFAALTGIDPPPPNTQELLDAASAAIRRYCGWHISPVVTEDLVVDGSGGREQFLPTLRLVDLIALSETRPGGTINVYAPTEVQWSRGGYLRTTGWWTPLLRGIATTIKHGFETVDTADLAQMSCTMAARALASPFGQTSQTVGSVSMALSGGPSGGAGGVSLYEDQAAQLDGYRLHGRP